MLMFHQGATPPFPIFEACDRRGNYDAARLRLRLASFVGVLKHPPTPPNLISQLCLVQGGEARLATAPPSQAGLRHVGPGDRR